MLWTRRHGNKLRTGHLKGNRFRLRLRGVRDVGAAREAFSRLVARGRAQLLRRAALRARGDNADRGKLLLLGQRLPEAAGPLPAQAVPLRLPVAPLQPGPRARACAAGTFDQALLGDVLRKEDTGGLFVCEAPEVDSPRVAAFEVSPAGPMFGPKMTPAAHGVAEAEAALLAEEGVTLSDFQRGGGETEGTRRPYRVRIGAPELTPEGRGPGAGLRAATGAYATEVLAELLKEG